MKALNTIQVIGKVYLYVVGAFFILMAFDCFDTVGCPECANFWEHLGCFAISISPGVAVILVNYFLRNKPHILGMILTLLSFGAFFLFKFYREFIQKIPMFILIVIIPIAIGILFIVTYYKKEE
jgi:hypothetical protein